MIHKAGQCLQYCDFFMGVFIGSISGSGKIGYMCERLIVIFPSDVILNNVSIILFHLF